MKLKKINAGLRKELPRYAKTNTLTPKLKRLLIELIWRESDRKCNEFVSENTKILCESEAYVAACKNSCYVKSGDPIECIGLIIRNSYTNTMLKHGK